MTGENVRLSFAQRLHEEFDAGRRLCAGIDPHASVLAEWGLPDNAASAEYLAREMIQAAAGIVACIKPQIAFFERFGAAGFAVLERVFREAREAELLIIADVKRGDIGSSFQAYADAWLQPGSPLEADAMTVAAYQGFGTLDGALSHVHEHGKGIFVLAATSNPEAREVQLAKNARGLSIAAQMVADAQRANLTHPNASASPVGAVGVVLGATISLADYGISTEQTPDGPVLPVLAPGFGFQGAQVSDAKTTFGALSEGLIVSESRSLIGRGNRGIAARMRNSAERIAEAFALETE